MTPVLRPGALVVCDNVDSGRKQYAEYLSYVRDPDGPFTSITIRGSGGLEVSQKNWIRRLDGAGRGPHSHSRPDTTA